MDKNLNAGDVLVTILRFRRFPANKTIELGTIFVVVNVTPSPGKQHVDLLCDDDLIMWSDSSSDIWSFFKRA